MFKKITISILIILSMLFNFMSITVLADDAEYNSVAVSKILASTNLSQLQAKAAILMDSASGTIIMEQNSNQTLPIASVTKVMSMLLIMEALDSGKIKFEDMVPISDHAVSMGGSQLYLDTRESKMYTVTEILKGVAIHSSNDATVAMAEMIAGSEGAFVSMMNERARALGLNNTNFLDCTGLTDDGHYSTAYDMGVIARELITKHPKILEYTSIRLEKFGEGKRQKPMELLNTNRLLGKYDGMVGLKTGFTNKAGHNLVAVAKKNDLQLISVVLGEPNSDTRWAETVKLLDSGFANYENATINKKGEEAGEVQVLKGLKTTVKALYADDVNILVKKGDKAKINRELVWEENITAPVKAGQKLGEAIFKVDEKEIGKAELVSSDDVQKASFIRLFFRMVVEWFGIGRK